MLFFYVGDVVLVLVYEDCSTLGVQCFPEESFMGETEDEEVARGGTMPKDVGD